MNTYNWEIASVEYKAEENEKNRIYLIHWYLIAVSSEKKEFTNINNETFSENYKASVYGAQYITLNDTSDFIEYTELTKDKVIAWLENAMGIDAIAELKNNLDAQLAKLKIPQPTNKQIEALGA
jgi:hypothetical protein